MKPIYWFILLLVIGASAWIILHTAGIEPRVSETIDLNWRFSQEDDSSFYQTDYNDAHWKTVSLPHDWMINGEIKEDNPSSMAGGFYPGGIGWYRKQLDLSAYDSKKQFYLVFDGVYMNADVWINGIHLGKHKYGYIGFHYDISKYVHTDTINVIAVRTDCSLLPVDRWYSGAGIYRHVRLIATDPLHFPVQNSRITTAEVDGDRIVISEIEVVNHERRSKRFKIKSDLVAPDGSLVSSTLLSRTIHGKSSIIIKEEQIIPEPEFWSDKNPALYTLNNFLIHKKKITDNIQTSFGVRDIEFSPDSGFILNKKKVWLKGVCIHHDGGALGSAVPEATWEYRLNSLKELGVNALRLSHNPHAPEVLDLCDRMGFLVIDEMYDKWEMTWERVNADFAFTENYKEDLEYFIRRDQNHPSVIAWSMGNETIEQLEDPELGVKWYTELTAIVQDLDSTRMVTAGLHPGYPSDGIEIPSSYIHVTPLVSYNYRTDSLASWHKKYPELNWIASETKAYNVNRRSNFEEISYKDNSWLDMEPFIAGQFIWSGIDYFGETSGWPNRAFYNGLLKTTGEIKPHAYYTQSIYSDEPVLKIVVRDMNLVDSLNRSTNWQLPWAGAPVSRHWNFEKSEKLQIIVYSNCPEIELSLNDSALGTIFRNEFEDGVIKSEVLFRPGMIKATASVKNRLGQVITISDSLMTAGKPTMIVMKPDKTKMIADGKDVVHIETSVVDSSGITYPRANHVINYEVDGPGDIKVIDNGDPADNTPYESSKKRVYYGSHLVIIQSTLEPGDLIISATAEGLEPAQVHIKSLTAKEKKQP